jgi:membrane protein implicated in regulation of membrane protease activity
VQWDDGNGMLESGLKGGNVTIQLGEDLVIYVYNAEATSLLKGEIVYVFGAQGNRLSVKRASAASESTSVGTIGMVLETITAGGNGFVETVGVVNKLDTTGLTAGLPIYLSAVTAGAYTQTAPTAPNHLVTLGYVERVDNIVGSVYIKVDNGYEINELHNVYVTGVTAGQVLTYNGTYWTNKDVSGGTF